MWRRERGQLLDRFETRSRKKKLVGGGNRLIGALVQR